MKDKNDPAACYLISSNLHLSLKATRSPTLPSILLLSLFIIIFYFATYIIIVLFMSYSRSQTKPISELQLRPITNEIMQHLLLNSSSFKIILSAYVFLFVFSMDLTLLLCVYESSMYVFHVFSFWERFLIPLMVVSSSSFSSWLFHRINEIFDSKQYTLLSLFSFNLSVQLFLSPLKFLKKSKRQSWWFKLFL